MTEPLEPERDTTEERNASTARDDLAYAEPWWMQDIRLAQAKIAARRAALSPARLEGK